MKTAWKNDKMTILTLPLYRTFLLLVMVSFIGCATIPSSKAVAVQDADQRIVESCKFVGSVSGTSGWGDLAEAIGISNAKNEAREKAAQLSATHIVWTLVEGGHNPNVTANAYKCE